MAIDPIRVAGHFIPNKDGYPAALSETPKTEAQKAAELSLDNAASGGTAAADSESGTLDLSA